MSTMTEAFVKAGVAQKSQMERIWTFVRDKPNRTSKRIRSELNTPQASTLLWQMKVRGMVQSTTETTARGKQTVWCVEPSMRGVYERLPVKGPLRSVPVGVAEGPATAVVEPEATPSLDNLTIAQAKALYKALHKMFG